MLKHVDSPKKRANNDLQIIFTDLTKDFDKVDRDILWIILKKFVTPPKFLSIFKQFHNGMQACMLLGGL